MSIGIDFGIGIDQNSWYRTVSYRNQKSWYRPSLIDANQIYRDVGDASAFYYDVKDAVKITYFVAKLLTLKCRKIQSK
jgi:hypothetical protein